MIKSVLAAIDFSNCSINALEHAVNIAQKAGAEVIMVWVNRPDSSKEIFSEQTENPEEEVKKRFQSLIEKYSNILENRISYKIGKGKIYEEIVHKAELVNASLIITGTHGASGFQKFWLGSNAYKIVMSTPLPVLTIPARAQIVNELKRIVLPIDSTPETRQKIFFTCILAQLFKARVHVLAVNTSKSKSSVNRVAKYANQVIEYFKEEEVDCMLETRNAENVTQSTIEYAESIDANLISIMTEQEKSTANILLGPYASQMINTSPIPVLCIHPRVLTQNIMQ